MVGALQAVADPAEQRQAHQFLDDCKTKLAQEAGVKAEQVQTAALVAGMAASNDIGESPPLSPRRLLSCALALLPVASASQPEAASPHGMLVRIENDADQPERSSTCSMGSNALCTPAALLPCCTAALLRCCTADVHPD